MANKTFCDLCGDEIRTRTDRIKVNHDGNTYYLQLHLDNGLARDQVDMCMSCCCKMLGQVIEEEDSE